jgi:hypothetical protein
MNQSDREPIDKQCAVGQHCQQIMRRIVDRVAMVHAAYVLDAALSHYEPFRQRVALAR